MKNLKKYEELKKALMEYEEKIPRFQEEIKRLEESQKTLDEQALEAEILGTEDKETKKMTADKHKKVIDNLKEEMKKAEKAKEIIKKELKRIRSIAKTEIRNHYKPLYEKAARKLFKKLKEAEVLERELVRIKDEADSLVISIDTNPGICALPWLPRLIIEKNGESQDYSPINLFKRHCEMEGYRIE